MIQREKEINEVIEQVEDWKGGKVVYKYIDKGITNHNWKVEVNGKSYFVKIPGRNTNLFVDRKNCHEANIIAQNEGIGPKVVYFFEDNLVEIFEWLEGYEDTKFGNVYEKNKFYKMVETVRKFHKSKLKLPLKETAFDQIRKMLSFEKKIKTYLPIEIYQMEWYAQRIEEAIVKSGIEYVPCHNDVWTSNFMWNEKKKDIKMIDFEYASMNDECYDLGIFSGGNYFTEYMDKELINFYYGSYDEKKFARFKLYKIIADIKWSIWSCVQIVYSDIKSYDYFNWLNVKLMRLKYFLLDPRLEYWIMLLNDKKAFDN